MFYLHAEFAPVSIQYYINNILGPTPFRGHSIYDCKISYNVKVLFSADKGRDPACHKI